MVLPPPLGACHIAISQRFLGDVRRHHTYNHIAHITTAITVAHHIFALGFVSSAYISSILAR